MGEHTQSFRQKEASFAGETLPWAKNALWLGVRAFILQQYWKVIFTIGTTVIALETVEHLPTVTNKEPFYYGEIFLVGMLLLVTGFLIQMLVRTVSERTRALDMLHVKKNISLRLAASCDRKGIAEQLVEGISALAPGTGIELYLYGSNRDRLYQAAHTNIAQPIDQATRLLPGSDPCHACFLQKSTARYSISSCHRQRCPMFAGGAQDYCLQLSLGSWLLGVLHLAAPEGKTLPDEQVKVIENVAVDISSALGIAIQKIERDEFSLTQKINSVQLDIARDLHDTLGQNISYLRMKLENMVDTGSGADISPQIAHMSSVANESYDLIRGTLALLQPNRSAHFHDLLAGHASQVMDRTGLEITIDCCGDPKPITNGQMRQIFYIYREAMNNIEKHAHARMVHVETVWHKQELTMTITDDGRGFDPDQAFGNNHYGLRFMRDRTEKLKGQLSIKSWPGAGACLTVRFPYETEISPMPVSDPIYPN